jgi:cytochrome c-type biogenesis protein CcmF
VLGRSAVLLGLALAGTGSVLGFYAGATRNMAAWKWARRAGNGFAAFMIAANLLMVYALVTHDFTVSYVAEIGSVRTPLYFTVVSLWASLDGSILLWAGVLGLYVVGLNLFEGQRHREYMPYTLGVLLAIAAFFGLLVAGIANPFEATTAQELAMMCRSFGCTDGMPLDGPGPNPLLQNHWLMAVHPPTLYLGYVGMAVPFSMCSAALLAGRLEAGWVLPLRRWFLIPWAWLTGGIVLGGWWSYAVLGWGGFWAWDPVENASFMPWLVGTAFLHSAMLMQRRGDLKTWTLLLGMSTFLFTMFGTFLTRSGVFNSVHAFADGPVGPTFLVFIAIASVFTITLIALREHTLRDRLPRKRTRRRTADPASLLMHIVVGVLLLGPPVVVISGALFTALTTLSSVVGVPYLGYPGLVWWVVIIPFARVRLLSRDFAIVLQNLAFAAFTFMVFLGTIYPLLADGLRDRQVTVGEPYFDAFSLPIGVTIVWLMGVGPMLPWGQATATNAFRKMVPGLIVAGLSAFMAVTITWLLGGVDVGGATGIAGWFWTVWGRLWTWLAVYVCMFAVTVNVAEYIEPILVRVTSKGENPLVASGRVFLRGRRRFGGHIAHMGVVMAVLAIAFSSAFRHEGDFLLMPGQTAEFGDFTLTLAGTEKVTEPQRTADVATVAVTRNGRSWGDLAPRLNFYPARREPFTSPDVSTSVIGDLQLSVLKIDAVDGFTSVRAIWMPGMVWLWLSPLLMMLGTAIAAFPRLPSATRRVPQGAEQGAEQGSVA